MPARASSNRSEARENLLAGVWQAGGVTALLERTGNDPLAIEGQDADPDRPLGSLVGDKYRLSEDQTNTILDLQLHRLTGLEHDKLMDEFVEILSKIAYLQGILNNHDELMGVIVDELNEVLTNFGDARKTDIVASRVDFSRADLIAEQDMVLTVSQTGYAKTQPVGDYSTQKRGGRGKSATAMKDDDIIEHLVVTSSHNTVLCFTCRGRVFWLKVYDVPIASRGSRGRPMVNLIPLQKD